MPLLLVPALLAVLAVAYGAYGETTGVRHEVVVAAGVGFALFLVAAFGALPASWVGVAGWIGIASGITWNVMSRTGTYQPRLRPAMTMLTVTIALAVLGWLVGAWAWRRTSPVDGVRQLASVFVRPKRDFSAAVLGAVMVLPLLGAYAPTVFDADSSWLVLLSGEVHQHGVKVLEQNQEALIPPYVMGPLLRHGGYQWALGFGAICLAALVGLTAYLARRLTGRTCAAFAAACALLMMSEMTNRIGILPMYAACFFFGYGGGWLVHRAMQLGLRDGWWRAVLGGVSLVAATETHAIGQLFYLVPFVLVVLHLRRKTIGPLVVTLASMFVAALPRVWVNYQIGGFSNFRSNRADWIVSKGYLDLVNENYFANLRTRSPIGYLTYVPEYLNRAIGERNVLLLLVPIALAALLASWRSRAFVAAAAGMYLVALAVAAPSVQPRYFTPLAVGTAILAGVGVARAWDVRSDTRYVGVALVGVLALPRTSRSRRGSRSVTDRSTTCRTRTRNGSQPSSATRGRSWGSAARSCSGPGRT